MSVKDSQESLTNKIVDILRNKIITGQLYPNERLLEEDIAKEMQTSRAPIREAFEKLASEGLVRRNGRKGTFVSKFTLEDIKEVYSLRALIESYAVSRFIENADSEDYKYLGELILRMDAAALANSHSKMANLNLKFHLHIINRTKHKRIIQLWKDMYQQIRLIMVAVSEGYSSLKDIAEHHRIILQHIISGEDSRAEIMMRDHILSTGDRLVRTLESRLTDSLIGDPLYAPAEQMES